MEQQIEVLCTSCCIWGKYIYIIIYILLPGFLNLVQQKNHLTLLLGNLKQRKVILYQGIFSIRRTLKTLRDQELCLAAHLFAEEVNPESDQVGENLATKGDELYFQDLPIYNKLNISSAKVGEKTAKEPQSVAPPPRRQQSPWASRSGSCSPCVTNYTNRLESYQSSIN